MVHSLSLSWNMPYEWQKFLTTDRHKTIWLANNKPEKEGKKKKKERKEKRKKNKHLEIVKIVNFMLYIFYHNKKEKEARHK